MQIIVIVTTIIKHDFILIGIKNAVWVCKKLKLKQFFKKISMVTCKIHYNWQSQFMKFSYNKLYY